MARSKYKQELESTRSMLVQMTARCDELVSQQAAFQEELLGQISKTITAKGQLLQANQQIERLQAQIEELKNDGD